MKQKRYSIVLIFGTLLALLIAACSPAGSGGDLEPTVDSSATTQTLFVGSEQVDCEGEGPQKCLLVKENVEDEYSFFYDTIEGFEWKEGFEYQLLVELTQVENPPAGASSQRYQLIEVVNMQAVEAPVAPTLSIIDGKWAVGELIVDGTPIRLPYESYAFLLIDGEMVSGSAGCNNFSGTATFNRGDVTFNPLAVTRRMCADESAMTHEDALLALFEAATTFTTERDNVLHISNADGTMTATFNRVREQTLFVGAEQADCVGVAPQKCLLVKENVEDEYTFFYSQINGFEWEAGYEYELLIEVSDITNVPADASSLRYELVEIVSQTAVSSE